MKARGRGVGVPNYKNELLINVVEAVLPDGALQWGIVAQRYKESSGEKELRDTHDIKRHFTIHKNMCDNGKKVTGSAAPKPQVARCQAIWEKILRKSAASNCGGGSSSDDDNSDDEEESYNDDNFDGETQFEENENENEEEQEENNDYIDDNEEEFPEPPNLQLQRDVPPQFDAQRAVPPRLEDQRLPIPLPRAPIARPEGYRAPSPFARVPVLGQPRNEGKSHVFSIRFCTALLNLPLPSTSYCRTTCPSSSSASPSSSSASPISSRESTISCREKRCCCTQSATRQKCSRTLPPTYPTE